MLSRIFTNLTHVSSLALTLYWFLPATLIVPLAAACAKGEAPRVFGLASDPSALAPDTSTPVVFTARVEGADRTTLFRIDIEGDLDCRLNDLGAQGDLEGNDGTFSGTAIVDTMGLEPGTCLSIVAVLSQGTEAATSDAYKICISSLPLELAPSDTANLVRDPDSGAPAIADEVLLTIAAGTADPAIRQIASSVGGTVVGSIPGLDVYQIKLHAPVSSSAQLAGLLAKLNSFDNVLSAEANTMDNDQTVVPPDS